MSMYRPDFCEKLIKLAAVDTDIIVHDLADQLEYAQAVIEKQRALLRRYRNEVPLGHQPHMLAHEVDEALRLTEEET